MANSIFNQFLGSEKLIITNKVSNSQVISGVSVAEVNIKFSAQLLKNIREDGSPIIDGKIILPCVVQIKLYCTKIDDVEAINVLLNDINVLYSMSTRGIFIDNVMLERDELSQTSAVISAVPINLSFKQVLLGEDTAPVVKQTPDSNTIIGGIRQTVTSTVSDLEAITDKFVSAASRIF